MKNIILIMAVITLQGCGYQQPINESTAKAIKDCLDMEKTPRYFSDMSRVEFTCVDRS